MAKLNNYKNYFTILFVGIAIIALCLGINNLWQLKQQINQENNLQNNLNSLKQEISQINIQNQSLTEKLEDLEARTPWHRFISEKWGISFLYPKELRANYRREWLSTAFDTYNSREKANNKDPDKTRDTGAIRTIKNYATGDAYDFYVSEELKNEILRDFYCYDFKERNDFYLPIKFETMQNGRYFFCETTKNDNNDFVVLSAVGASSQASEKMAGMLLIIQPNAEPILINGEILVLEENRNYISKKVQEIFEAGEMNMSTIEDYPPTEEEIYERVQSDITQENMQLLQKMAESIEILVQE